jgi:hypothetical protein
MVTTSCRRLSKPGSSLAFIQKVDNLIATISLNKCLSSAAMKFTRGSIRTKFTRALFWDISIEGWLLRSLKAGMVEMQNKEGKV